MDRIKLLIVDDSILFREVLSKCVQDDGMIDVIAKVSDAYAARDAILQYEPDVMTLDLEIPRMDGEDFLKKLLPQYYIPTIVISGTADRKPGCLSVGAVDFLAKPLNRSKRDVEIFAEDVCQAIRKAYKTTHPNAELEAYGKPLLSPHREPTSDSSTQTKFSSTARYSENYARSTARPSVLPKTTDLRKMTADAQKAVAKITQGVMSKKANSTPPSATGATGATGAASATGAAATIDANHQSHQTNPTNSTNSTNSTSSSNSVSSAAVPSHKFNRSDVVIALGASTGGTEALEAVLREFPEDTPPIVVVQHMPAGFTKLYAERLNRSCKMTVKEAEDGDRLRRGLVIIGAGGFQLRVLKDSKGYYVSSKVGEKVSGHCPSVDVLFNSVAESVGKNAVGAILTGMGRDGADGMKHMRDRGAFTVGQDKESCVVYGMPMEAYKIGAVQVQAPLTEIAGIIISALS